MESRESYGQPPIGAASEESISFRLAVRRPLYNNSFLKFNLKGFQSP